MLVDSLKKFSEKTNGKLIFDYDLKKTNWFNIGGNAKAFFKPENLKDLINFLKIFGNKEKIFILGAGSNILIKDKGFDGVVVKLGKNFSNISILPNKTIIAGSASMDKSVAKFSVENEVGGLEFLSCIPGTIGGGIRMNSGCYGEDISNIIASVQVMDLEGRVKVIPSSDIKFSYRGCDLDNSLIFISATFKGKNDSNLNIRKKINNLIEKKKRDQPSKIKTCGSTFKNPKNNKAWSLIKNSGCAGMKIGDAHISEKHCNFFVNKGNAKSQDLENLINKVKSEVLKKTGIKLELELEIIGEKL